VLTLEKFGFQAYSCAVFLCKISEFPNCFYPFWHIPIYIIPLRPLYFRYVLESIWPSSGILICINGKLESVLASQLPRFLHLVAWYCG